MVKNLLIIVSSINKNAGLSVKFIYKNAQEYHIPVHSDQHILTALSSLLRNNHNKFLLYTSGLQIMIPIPWFTLFIQDEITTLALNEGDKHA